MRKIISLVLALALALCGIAFAEETAALCEAEYTVTENGANVIVEAAAENVTFDVTENYLNEWTEGGFETATFKAGAIKTSIKLASMLEQGTHFNIILNNAAEMDEGEAKAAAGVAKSSARLGFMLVNEDGTLTDLSDKLEGSITLYVAWDGATNSIRAITNNGSGYQRTQMNCVKGYENGMTTVTCYRLISASYITLNGLSISVNPTTKVGDLGSNFKFCALIYFTDITGVPDGVNYKLYCIKSNGEKHEFIWDNSYQGLSDGFSAESCKYNPANGRYEFTIKLYVEYNGSRSNTVTLYYYYTKGQPD